MVDDWYNHAQYFPVFLIGFVMASATGFWETLQRLRWPALALAALSYAAMVHLVFLRLRRPSNANALAHGPARGLGRGQWCAIAAALGFAYRFRNADSGTLRYLALAVFPVYVLHQTVIVVLAHRLKSLAILAPAESALLLATYALSALAHMN